MTGSGWEKAERMSRGSRNFGLSSPQIKKSTLKSRSRKGQGGEKSELQPHNLSPVESGRRLLLASREKRATAQDFCCQPQGEVTKERVNCANRRKRGGKKKVQEIRQKSRF